ncbi:MAG TPA: O-antigen ligase family protein [Actinoplanes sp.]|jgi:O-antigen ligase
MTAGTGRHPAAANCGLVGEGRRRPGLVVIVAFLVSLAGRFTLERLGISVPLVNDVRVPLFAALLMSFALELKGSGHRGGSGVRSLFAILALLGYQILSATWAPNGAATGAAVGDLAACAILVFVYVTLAEWDRDRVVRVTLACFYAAAWVYFLVAASGRGHASSGRWAALGGGPNVFVRIMVLGALSSMYFYFRAGRKPIWLLGIPAFLTGALASGSRGGLLALASTLACAIWVALPRLRPSSSLKALLTTAVLAGVTWLLAGDAVGGFIQKRFVQGTLQQGYTSDRDVLFKLAFGLFMRRPFFGTGVNGFYVETNRGSGERYVHNLPLAVAAEGGAIGLLLLINAFVQLRHEFAKIPRSERSLEARAVGYCAIFVGGACLFSGDYYDARLMWVLLVLAAVRPAPIKRDTLQT